MQRNVLSVGFAIIIALAVAGPVMAAPSEHLNWGSQVNSGQCDAERSLIVNVVQKVVNTVDSGEGGNNWAFDSFSRTIKVWQTDDGYCVVVAYRGKFDAVAGQVSPGAGGVLDGDEDGTFEGGYRAFIAGVPRALPLWPTRGSIGATDYRCDILGNCPGEVIWIDQYFDPSYSFSYLWWGWVYHGGPDGSWVNASSGNSGDIN